MLLDTGLHMVAKNLQKVLYIDEEVKKDIQKAAELAPLA